MLTIFVLITYKDQRFKVFFQTKENFAIVSYMSLLCVQLFGMHSILFPTFPTHSIFFYFQISAKTREEYHITPSEIANRKRFAWFLLPEHEPCNDIRTNFYNFKLLSN